MALTPQQIDALPTYTAAQHLKMWLKADLEVAACGSSNSINGRSLTRANEKEITAKITFWTEQAYLEANPNDGGAIALVRYGDAR